MAVLVTGGAGYIGSVAVERLLASGEQVVVYDNLSTGHRGAVSPDAVFVEGDIHDTDRVATALKEHNCDTVMHFAAFSLVGESVELPMKYFHNNVVGAHSVLNAMVQSDVKQFILSSTAAVYGDPDEVPITEKAATRPLNPYGLSKRIIEQMLEWHDPAYGLKYVALRYFNACGASKKFGEDHDPETHLIPNIFFAATGRRDKISVFGDDYDTPDGTCVRDYIHIEDLADAHIKARNYLSNGGDSVILNLGNSIGNSVLEVIEAVKRVTGKDFPVEHAARRAGDADKLVASSKKAQSLLGWTPEKGDINTIVEDAWRWMSANPDGYGD